MSKITPIVRRVANAVLEEKMKLLKTCIWMIFVFLPLLAGGQRLPYGLSAKHYDLTFTPDLQKAVFSGDETLEVEVNKAATDFILNSVAALFTSTSSVSSPLKTAFCKSGVKVRS